ncbi:hypothetical protein PUN28_002776 [Cardiocondyla obscurior]|uniref:Uncharacterized protein n=1 Tax=Cardiocondyla obscurior TaxID=286306 RepID=A0AAW2GW34_9HYME
MRKRTENNANVHCCYKTKICKVKRKKKEKKLIKYFVPFRVHYKIGSCLNGQILH